MRASFLFLLAGVAACAAPAAPPRAASAPPIGAAQAFQREAQAISAMGESPDWAEVVDRLRRFVADHPGYALAWYNLGVAYERVGDAARAAEAYDRALAADENLTPARVNLVALAVGQGDLDRAGAYLEALVDADGRATAPRLALARYRVMQQRFDEAERLAKAVLNRESKAEPAYCVLADVYLARKNRGRGRLVVARGLKVAPKSACLHRVLGRLLLADGETEAGVAALEQAVAEDPQAWGARFQLAEIALKYRDFGRAATHLTAVVEADSTAGEAWVSLGIAYRSLGRFDEAERAYAAAAKIPRTEAAAQFNLGILYLRYLERLDDAEACLQRYAELVPTGQDADALLAEIDQMKRFQAQEEAAAADAAAAQEAGEVEESAAEAEDIGEDTPAREADEATDKPAQATPAPAPPRPPARKRTRPKARKKKSPPEGLAPDDFE